MSVGLIWLWLCLFSVAQSLTTIVDEWNDDYSFSKWSITNDIVYRSQIGSAAWFARQKNTKHEQSVWSMSRSFQCSASSVLQLSFSILYSCDVTDPDDGVTVFVDDQLSIDSRQRDASRLIPPHHTLDSHFCASSTVINRAVTDVVMNAHQPFVLSFNFRVSASSAEPYIAVRDIAIKCGNNIASEHRLRSLLEVPLTFSPTLEPTVEPTRFPTILAASSTLFDIDIIDDNNNVDSSGETGTASDSDLSYLVLWWSSGEQIGWKIFIVVGIVCAFIGCIATACLCGYFQGKHGYRKPRRRRRPRPRPKPRKSTQDSGKFKLTMDASEQGANAAALFGYPEDNGLKAINGIYHMSITMDDRDEDDDEEDFDLGDDDDDDGNDSDDVSEYRTREDSVQADTTSGRVGAMMAMTEGACAVLMEDDDDGDDDRHDTRYKHTFDGNDGEEGGNHRHECDERQVKRIIVRVPSSTHGLQRIGIDTDEDEDECDCDGDGDEDDDMKMEYLPTLGCSTSQPLGAQRALSANAAPLRRIATEHGYNNLRMLQQHNPPRRRLLSIGMQPRSQPQAPSHEHQHDHHGDTTSRRQFAYAYRHSSPTHKNKFKSSAASKKFKLFVDDDDGDNDVDDDTRNGTVRKSNDTVVSSATTSNGYWLTHLQHQNFKSKPSLQTELTPPPPPPPPPQPQSQPQTAPPHMCHAYPHYNQYQYTPFNAQYCTTNSNCRSSNPIHIQVEHNNSNARARVRVQACNAGATSYKTLQQCLAPTSNASSNPSMSSSSTSSCTSIDSESESSVSKPPSHDVDVDANVDEHHMHAPSPQPIASPSHKSLKVPKHHGHKAKRSGSDTSFPTETATSVTSAPIHNPMDNHEYMAMLSRQSNHNGDTHAHVQVIESQTQKLYSAHPLQRQSFDEHTTTTQTMDTYSESDFSHTITQSDYREYMPFSSKHRKPSFQTNNKKASVKGDHHHEDMK